MRWHKHFIAFSTANKKRFNALIKEKEFFTAESMSHAIPFPPITFRMSVREGTKGNLFMESLSLQLRIGKSFWELFTASRDNDALAFVLLKLKRGNLP